MSEQILYCADMCPSTFQSSFHALTYVFPIGVIKHQNVNWKCEVGRFLSRPSHTYVRIITVCISMYVCMYMHTNIPYDTKFWRDKTLANKLTTSIGG